MDEITVKRGYLKPHCLFFLFYNCVYFVPLLLLVLLDYKEGMDEQLDWRYLTRITSIYCFGVGMFFLGSGIPSLSRLWAKPRQFVLKRRTEGPFFKVLMVFVVLLFLVSKWLLVPLGVYSEYAFATDQMVGGVWSFSMFVSETLLFLSVFVLYSRSRHNLTLFLALSGINAINLLHGTRIFFIINVLILAFYSYTRATLTKKKLIASLLVVLLLSYGVFLVRSHVAIEGSTFSYLRLISPIMYEGVFSQLSLMELVKRPDLWNVTGSPQDFIADVALFTTPRFLLADKEGYQFINRFSELSPLGAFSGYAQGLIYFGVLFPFFYFLLGLFGSILLERARASAVIAVFYVYFVCDFLFRIMRDGYSIPVKMFLNAVMIWFAYEMVRLLFRVPRRFRITPQP